MSTETEFLAALSMAEWLLDGSQRTAKIAEGVAQTHAWSTVPEPDTLDPASLRELRELAARCRRLGISMLLWRGRTIYVDCEFLS